MNTAVGAAMTIAALVVTLALAIATHPSAPRCPSEDSCTADYRDGSWHIEPVIP